MNLEQARFNMIEQQIRTWEVLDTKVLELLSVVPREEFVPAGQRSLAFVDTHVALGHGEVMMQPKQEARLLQELQIGPEDRALEIGTGSGYVTALLANLAREVDTVDIYEDFVESAKAKLEGRGLDNITFGLGDASQGWEGSGPYDVILLTGSVPEMPRRYVDNLRPHGRLAAVVGTDPIMEAVLISKTGDGSVRRVSLFDTSLPPLVNAARPRRFVF